MNESNIEVAELTPSYGTKNIYNILFIYPTGRFFPDVCDYVWVMNIKITVKPL